MDITIDGSTKLPTFQEYYKNQELCDVMLVINDYIPHDDAQTIVSSRAGSVSDVGMETDEEFGTDVSTRRITITQVNETASVNDVPGSSGNAVVGSSWLEIEASIINTNHVFDELEEASQHTHLTDAEVSSENELSSVSGGSTSLQSGDNLLFENSTNSDLGEGRSLHLSTAHSEVIMVGIERSRTASLCSYSDLFMDNQDVGRHWEKHCHKLILAKHSPVLEKIIIRARAELEIYPPREMSQKEIDTNYVRASICETSNGPLLKLELVSIRVESMEAILNFIYSGKICCQAAEMTSLIEDACKLNFPIVLQLCESFLIEYLKTTNFSVLQHAHISKNEAVVNACIKIITKNISETQFYTKLVQLCHNLPLGVLEQLMKSEDVDERNVENVFKLLIKWVRSNEEKCSQDFHELLQMKIKLLSSHFLINVLGKEDVIKRSHQNLNLIISTLQTRDIHSSNSTVSSTATQNFPHSSQSQAVTIDNDQYVPSAEDVTTKPNLSETLLLLGGLFPGSPNSGPHQILDPVSRAWKHWSGEFVGSGFQAEVLGNTLVCMGGFVQTEVQNKVRMLDLVENTWSEGPSMLQSRCMFASCIVTEKVFVFGGEGSDSQSLDSCEMLEMSENISMRTWKRIPSMKFRRRGCSAVSTTFGAFVVGGMIGLGSERGSFTSSVEAYDTVSQRWRSVASMNNPRSHFAIAAHQSFIYVFGGFGGEHTLASCERYDLLNDSWQLISSLPSPRDHCAAAVLGNLIWIVGGESKENIHHYSKLGVKPAYGDVNQEETYCYNIDTGGMTKGPPLNFGIQYCRCVKIKQQIE